MALNRKNIKSLQRVAGYDPLAYQARSLQELLAVTQDELGRACAAWRRMTLDIVDRVVLIVGPDSVMGKGLDILTAVSSERVEIRGGGWWLPGDRREIAQLLDGCGATRVAQYIRDLDRDPNRLDVAVLYGKLVTPVRVTVGETIVYAPDRAPDPSIEPNVPRIIEG